MRTVILLGLSAIADAIDKDWIGENAGIYAIVFIASAIMDVFDFFRDKK